jgi:hypothetical protein
MSISAGVGYEHGKGLALTLDIPFPDVDSMGTIFGLSSEQIVQRSTKLHMWMCNLLESFWKFPR